MKERDRKRIRIRERERDSVEENRKEDIKESER